MIDAVFFRIRDILGQFPAQVKRFKTGLVLQGMTDFMGGNYHRGQGFAIMYA